jgi:cyanobactin maturation PatA/PatG family protease
MGRSAIDLRHRSYCRFPARRRPWPRHRHPGGGLAETAVHDPALPSPPIHDAAILPGLAALHALTSGDPRICIAVLDGPVDRGHACLAGADLDVADPGDAGLDAAPGGPACLHGTHVASLLFGRPGSAVPGVASGCRGLLVPIFRDAPEGGLHPCPQAELARALMQALRGGAQVINVSGGQPAAGTALEPALAQALAQCARHNVLVVAAAGNEGCDCVHLPAAVPGVLAVGAAGRDGRPLPASNWGGIYRMQGLLAPGEQLPGARCGGGTTRMSGTSVATALVSGIAALLLSLQLQLGQAPDPRAVRAALLRGARRGGPHAGASGLNHRSGLSGLLDIPRATRLILEGATMSEAEPGAHAAPAHDAPAPLSGPDASVSPLSGPDASVSPLSGPDASVSPLSGPDASVSPLSGPHTGWAPLPGPEAGLPPPLRRSGPWGPARRSPSPETPLPWRLRSRQGPPAHDGAKGITASGDCGCGSAAVPAPAQLVYALGTLGHDFGTLAHRDSFAQAMPHGANRPEVLPELLDHLDAHPHDAQSLIWTLMLDTTPIYAIVPGGAFAAATYERLRGCLRAQAAGTAELVSVPGVLGGSVRLASGQQVPLLVPEVRGLYCWSTSDLLAGALRGSEHGAGHHERATRGLQNFLHRVYYDLRNTGLAPRDRALNHAATNAFQAAHVISHAAHSELELDSIQVAPSPVCRPGSECYDVQVHFFDPADTAVANRVYRFTVDVSDVIPVSIGAVRSWSVRG